MAEGSDLGPVSKSRRTRLVSLSGESCDFVESFATRISIKDLRAKVAASKGVKPARIRFIRTSSLPETLEDDDEVIYKFSQIDGRTELCSTGEPLQLVLAPALQTTFTGRVKCHLDHRCEDERYQACTWEGDWVTITMEQRDLGPSMNDELRIFIGHVDLVRYGRLKDPHHRQLETWGNKDSGTLMLEVCKNMSCPRKDAPGRYQIAGLQGLRPTLVFDSFDCRQELGTLQRGVTVDVLEVRLPCEAKGPYREYVLGRIDFNGAEGWIPLCVGKKVYATRLEQESLYKLVLSRRYLVERGEFMYDGLDISELWFAEERERNEFVAAFRSWEVANPQPPLCRDEPSEDEDEDDDDSDE